MVTTTVTSIQIGLLYAIVPTLSFGKALLNDGLEGGEAGLLDVQAECEGVNGGLCEHFSQFHIQYLKLYLSFCLKGRHQGRLLHRRKYRRRHHLAICNQLVIHGIGEGPIIDRKCRGGYNRHTTILSPFEKLFCKTLRLRYTRGR